MGIRMRSVFLGMESNSATAKSATFSSVSSGPVPTAQQRHHNQTLKRPWNSLYLGQRLHFSTSTRSNSKLFRKKKERSFVILQSRKLEAPHYGASGQDEIWGSWEDEIVMMFLARVKVSKMHVYWWPLGAVLCLPKTCEKKREWKKKKKTTVNEMLETISAEVIDDIVSTDNIRWYLHATWDLLEQRWERTQFDSDLVFMTMLKLKICNFATLKEKKVLFLKDDQMSNVDLLCDAWSKPR